MKDDSLSQLLGAKNGSGQPLIAHISLDNSESAAANEPSTELDLKIYARLLWRWLWLLIFCAILSGGIAYYVSSLSTPIYRATSTLLIDQASNTASQYQDLLVSERIARTYAQMMTQYPLQEAVVGRLSLDPDVLSSDITNISVTPVRDTQLVQVSIEGISPTLVALVANTLPDVFIEELNRTQTQRFADSKINLQQQLDTLSDEIELIQISIENLGDALTPAEELEMGRLQNSLTIYQSNYANLLRNFEEIRLEEARSLDSISVTEPARVPVSPIRPRILVNTLLAAVVGAMLALGVVFLVEYLDDRIKSPKDAKRYINAPFLGAVSVINGDSNAKGTRYEKLITIKEPRNPITEAYRGVRTNLQFANIDRQIRSLLVTSSLPGEGKTTTAANLAVVMAQSGLSVAIIDADLRKPSLHKIFGINQRPGLIDALLDDDDTLMRYSPERIVQNLLITPCGQRPPNPAELLGSKRMQRLIERLYEQVDMVIFDAPPLLAVTDAQILSAFVDGVLFVVNRGTERAAVSRAAESLRQVDANVLGYVMNRMVRSDEGEYYYYNYYYDDDEPRTGTREVPVYTNGTGQNGVYEDLMTQHTTTISPAFRKTREKVKADAET